ncbi:MAG: DUF1566 domain-containing protein [Rhodocyclaceae bacterium]
MTTTIKRSDIPAVATATAGGFYAGLIKSDDQVFAIIAAPKAQGDIRAAWGRYGEEVTGAISYHDGMANTVAMAEAGSPIATQARAAQINGFTDWHVPSRDELETLYRAFKPTTDENYCSFRDGDNASSVPVGYPYTAGCPAQTQAPAFQAGGDEAFEPAWYWASTQDSAGVAWYQYFGDGYQFYGNLDYEGRVRFVRRLLVIE